jgi:hypothetical protein
MVCPRFSLVCRDSSPPHLQARAGRAAHGGRGCRPGSRPRTVRGPPMRHGRSPCSQVPAPPATARARSRCPRSRARLGGAAAAGRLGAGARICWGSAGGEGNRSPHRRAHAGGGLCGRGGSLGEDLKSEAQVCSLHSASEVRFLPLHALSTLPHAHANPALLSRSDGARGPPLPTRAPTHRTLRPNHLHTSAAAHRALNAASAATMLTKSSAPRGVLSKRERCARSRKRRTLRALRSLPSGLATGYGENSAVWRGESASGRATGMLDAACSAMVGCEGRRSSLQHGCTARAVASRSADFSATLDASCVVPRLAPAAARAVRRRSSE